jgi:mannose-6-phosphate isomerase-like protein (cupin superfamily)
MPVLKEGDALPEWSELTFFEIIRMDDRETRRFERRAEKERLFAGKGTWFVRLHDNLAPLERGAYFDMPRSVSYFDLRPDRTGAALVRIGGNWGEDIGGCGVFHMENSGDPKDSGDPVSYVKYTDFDSHFHDCDEYWVLFSGRAVIMTEGELFEAAAGECVATRMGDHHDILNIIDPIDGVYFETTLRGMKRLGHLWDHTHQR